MGFWGVEVKPGKKVNPYASDYAQGRLRITQATLGLGSSKERSILQCLGHDDEGPIFLCSLLPGKTESFLLDLEVEEDDGVDFSVIGARSIHLSGYFLPEEESEDGDDCEFDAFGEEASESGSEESSDYDSEDGFEDEFSNGSDLDTFPSRPVPKSGVVIEEIMDDEKAVKASSKPKLLKNKLSNSADNPDLQHQIVARSNNAPVIESEDEDGFPMSHTVGSKKEQGDNTTERVQQKKDGDDHTKSKKRDIKTVEQDSQTDRQNKKKKKKQKVMDEEGKNNIESNDSTVVNMKTDDKSNGVANGEGDQILPQEPSNNCAPSENDSEKKKKKKKKKKPQELTGSDENQHIATAADQKTSISASVDQQIDAKPSQVRTFANGLVVEELAMGKPDGKRAAPGKKVSVHYIGKLKKNGKIFDSNVGRAPFKFRLGIGEVIKGWDVGVNGMRVGDKRRLTIPPSMGYGDRGAGGKIPPNSWLVFDVELVDVC